MNEVEAYIRTQAIARGMDPDIAVKVANAEALRVFDPNKPDLGGDEGSSFGPFQLHYAGLSKNMPNPGLGDEFTKATGLDARNPATWKQQVDFSLDQASKGGWGPWMGAKAAGVGRWEGLKNAQAKGVTLTTVPGIGQYTAATKTAEPAAEPQVAATEPAKELTLREKITKFIEGEKNEEGKMVSPLDALAGAFTKKVDPQVAAANATITPSAIGAAPTIDPVMAANAQQLLSTILEGRRKRYGMSLMG